MEETDESVDRAGPSLGWELWGQVKGQGFSTPLGLLLYTFDILTKSWVVFVFLTSF